MGSYKSRVFLNCPFDKQYIPIFEAIVFTILDCGFEVRSALEDMNSMTPRLNKIIKLIKICRLGIHDLSRTEQDKQTKLPRFNMPFELGIFWGAKEYGDKDQKRKECLILDSGLKNNHRYKKFISDIAGYDIEVHQNDPSKAIKLVRDWLWHYQSKSIIVPDASVILNRYQRFTSTLSEYSEQIIESKGEPNLTLQEYFRTVAVWLDENKQA
jgi:hypothetical protein